MVLKFLRYSLALAIFTLPFQLKFLIYQAEWGRALENPYLSIFFSQTNLFLLISAVLFLVHKKQSVEKISFGNKNYLLLILSLFFCIALSLFVSPGTDNVFKFLVLTKTFELFVFYILIINKVLKFLDLVKVFVLAMTIQSLIAILQFTFQSDLGLQILGETDISTQNPLVARFYVLDVPFVRAYGTFPHPNILAGFLLLSFFFTFLIPQNFKNERNLLLAIQFFALLTTFSRTTLAFMLVNFIFFYFYHSKLHKYLKVKIDNIPKLAVFIFSVSLVTSILFFWIFRIINIASDSSVIERVQGFYYSLSIFLHHPFGVGFSHYTLFLDELKSTEFLPWQYQPVHNVFLLFLAECGIIGFLVLIACLIFVFKGILKKSKTFLIPEKVFITKVLFTSILTLFLISNFDHYLISLEQGRFLLVYIIALLSIFSSSDKNILPISRAK